MKTINVEELPDQVVRALENIAETFRHQHSPHERNGRKNGRGLVSIRPKAKRSQRPNRLIDGERRENR